MEYNKQISAMVPGDRVEGFYILKEAQIKTSNSGKPFLAATISDKSGSMDLKAWDYSGPVGAPEDAGKVVKVRGYGIPRLFPVDGFQHPHGPPRGQLRHCPFGARGPHR